MKTIKYLLALVALIGLAASCDTDIEAETIQKPYTYSDLYYQNLRDYKASDHSISFGWFAQYGAQNSMAVRFMGLPDSLDICSLWGGIPAKENTDIWEELRFVQKVKGTKMLVVAITRIDAETDEKEFKQAYLAAKQLPAGEERTAALNRSIEMYAEYFLDQVFGNDLDGFDADNEPEGDFLDGSNFIYFMQHLAKYMGPNPDITKEERLKLIQERYGKEATDTGKMLCVDGKSVSALAPVCNYFFQQTYGSTPGSVSGWPNEKVVYCANVGDTWQSATVGSLYTYARYQPATGRKGGFGAFFIHRDYNVHENNPYPYKRIRECIQIQNPAVY
jgi:hypothetical protein